MNTLVSLQTPLKKAISSTKPFYEKLEKLGVYTAEDFIRYYPRALEQLDLITNASGLVLDTKITLCGTFGLTTQRKTPRGRALTVSSLNLEDTTVEVVWFHPPFALKKIKPGDNVSLIGKLKQQYGKITLQNPEIHTKATSTEGGLRVIYPESPPLASRWIRTKIKPLLPLCSSIKSLIPAQILQNQGLMAYSSALKAIHTPTNEAHWHQARQTLAFEEFFAIQARLLYRKIKQKTEVSSPFQFQFTLENVKKDIQSLPFPLTNHQKKAFWDILKDFAKPSPMQRLIQGDVGAGKTVVGLLASQEVLRNEGQVAFMAPTEILARQHFKSAEKLFPDMPKELLVGSLTPKNKKKIQDGLKNGSIRMVFGTHALISAKMGFKELGLAIIDEQHRFGVKQRDVLAATKAHILHMTATPIPRSLSLVAYGDLDVSIIKEKPAGRKEIITRVIADQKTQEKCIYFMEDQIQKGRQIFWVCPLVEESEHFDAKAAITHFHEVNNAYFPNANVALLHGKMKPKEKEAIMKDFADHKYDVLVATSVIEVGVDVPNASVMVIEDADRFGLGQLHQFRGRIGRGAHQSYCFLMAAKPEKKNKVRLKAMEQSNDGFYLAEVDLKIRGAGEIDGTKQSGAIDLRIADWTDTETMLKARKAFEQWFENDPKLEKHTPLQQFLEQREEVLT